jgi:hypothetical protein
MNHQKLPSVDGRKPGWADRSFWQVKPLRDATLFSSGLLLVLFLIYMGYFLILGIAAGLLSIIPYAPVLA